jgi:hypothetical protein
MPIYALGIALCVNIPPFFCTLSAKSKNIYSYKNRRLKPCHRIQPLQNACESPPSKTIPRVSLVISVIHEAGPVGDVLTL